MTKLKEKDLLYYHREISFLRHMGKIFSKKYPKIARRLNFMESPTQDPHVDRLIESFAFLTAHLQQDIDNQMPRFSSALLGILYPHLVAPIPPMSIAFFHPSETKPSTQVCHIPKHTLLHAHSNTKDTCSFRTGYDTDVWPITMQSIDLIPSETLGFSLTHHAYVMKIVIRSLKQPLSKLPIQSLRFYINGTPIEQAILRQILFQESFHIAVQTKQDTLPRILKKDSLKPVGFSLHENLISCPDHAHPAYGLLQEYFSFPKKFMFFDIENLCFQEAENEVTLYLPITDASLAKSISFHSGLLLLGCTPIVNLFPKISEPLRFDHKKIEYRMVADYRREATTEIHSIQKLFTSPLDSSEAREIQPYFSYTHKETTSENNLFWSSRRLPSAVSHTPGTDLWLSFVNWNMRPELPPSEVVYASLLCTNRSLASQITKNSTLKPQDAFPIEHVLCLHQPTNTLYPSEEGHTQWQLISSLSANYLSLSTEESSLTTLKEILKLFSMTHQKEHSLEIDSLKILETKPIVRRFGKEAWRGFAKGTGLTLTVDESDAQSGMNVFLFCEVLSCFFGLYAPVNSFTELTLRSRNRETPWKTWLPRNGSQKIL